jgi:hypothetical protein
MGASDLLVKPISSADLLASVDRLNRRVQRVLIADEDPDLARLFRRVLRGRLDDDRILEAYHGEEVERLIEAANPDLLILSDALPGMDWRQCAIAHGKAAPLILTSFTFPTRSPSSENGLLQVFHPGGFPTSESLQIVQGILHVLAPGRIPPAPRVPAPEAVPAG